MILILRDVKQVMSTTLFLVFFIGVIFGVPVAGALGFGAIVALFLEGRSLTTIAQRLFTGVDSMALMALPFFILAGELATKTDIMDRLLDLANLLVGKLRGGLAYVSIVASMLFAGISGAANADAAGIGSVLIPAMKGDYGSKFSVTINSISSIVGPIIPPSIAVILYALVSPGASVTGLFMAGFLPGILIGLTLMVTTYLVVPKYYTGETQQQQKQEKAFKVIYRSVPALLVPVIILGGILGGVFTATEAGAVAVAYCLLYGLINRASGFTINKLFLAIRQCLLLSSMCFLIISTASMASWIFAYEGLPGSIEAILLTVTDSPWFFLLLANIILLFAGTILDTTALIVLFAPIMTPIAVSFGIHPVHFGIVFVFSSLIGNTTPPIGGTLMVSCGIGKVSIEEVVPVMLPYYLCLIVALILITYLPFITLWLPKITGII